MLKSYQRKVLNNWFSNASEIIDKIERCSPCYICGYIAHKEGCMILSHSDVTSEKEPNLLVWYLEES